MTNHIWCFFITGLKLHIVVKYIFVILKQLLYGHDKRYEGIFLVVRIVNWNWYLTFITKTTQTNNENHLALKKFLLSFLLYYAHEMLLPPISCSQCNWQFYIIYLVVYQPWNTCCGLGELWINARAVGWYFSVSDRPQGSVLPSTFKS